MGEMHYFVENSELSTSGTTNQSQSSSSDSYLMSDSTLTQADAKQKRSPRLKGLVLGKSFPDPVKSKSVNRAWKVIAKDKNSKCRKVLLEHSRFTEAEYKELHALLEDSKAIYNNSDNAIALREAQATQNPDADENVVNLVCYKYS